jgi:hypothetical protein
MAAGTDSEPGDDDLPRPACPAALRVSAARRWRQDAQAALSYARAERGHLAETAASSPPPPARARTPCSPHAANGSPTRRPWSTGRGLRRMDDILAGLTADPARLTAAIDQAAALLDAATRAED